jgi:hypothetical protein
MAALTAGDTSPNARLAVTTWAEWLRRTYGPAGIVNQLRWAG